MTKLVEKRGVKEELLSDGVSCETASTVFTICHELLTYGFHAFDAVHDSFSLYYIEFTG